MCDWNGGFDVVCVVIYAFEIWISVVKIDSDMGRGYIELIFTYSHNSGHDRQKQKKNKTITFYLLEQFPMISMCILFINRIT